MKHETATSDWPLANLNLEGLDVWMLIAPPALSKRRIFSTIEDEAIQVGLLNREGMRD